MKWLKTKVLRSIIKSYEYNVMSLSSELGLADLNTEEVDHCLSSLYDSRKKIKLLTAILADVEAE